MKEDNPKAIPKPKVRRRKTVFSDREYSEDSEDRQKLEAIQLKKTKRAAAIKQRRNESKLKLDEDKELINLGLFK